MFIYLLKATYDMTNYVKQEMLDRAYGATADVAFREQWFPEVEDRNLALILGSAPTDNEGARLYKRLARWSKDQPIESLTARVVNEKIIALKNEPEAESETLNQMLDRAYGVPPNLGADVRFQSERFPEINDRNLAKILGPISDDPKEVQLYERLVKWAKHQSLASLTPTVIEEKIAELKNKLEIEFLERSVIAMEKLATFAQLVKLGGDLTALSTNALNELVHHFIFVQDDVPHASDALVEIVLIELPNDDRNYGYNRKEIVRALKFDQISPENKTRLMPVAIRYLQYYAYHLNDSLQRGFKFGTSMATEETFFDRWLLGLKDGPFTKVDETINMVKIFLSTYALHLKTSLEDEKKQEEGDLLKKFIAAIKFEDPEELFNFKQKIQDLKWEDIEYSLTAPEPRVFKETKDIILAL